MPPTSRPVLETECARSTGDHIKIFVISLRAEQARRAYVQRELSDAGLAFRFFDAIEGTAAERHFAAIDPWSFLINARREPTLGEMGCYASHRSLWQHCVELDEPILVLEDDCELAPGFAAALKHVEAFVRKYGFVRLEECRRPRKINPLRLMFRPHKPVHPITQEGALTLYYLADPPTGMVGYALSPASAAKLVAASEALDAPVDRFMQRTWEHGVPLFGIEPPLVSIAPLSAASTIGVRTRTRNPVVVLIRVFVSGQAKIRRRHFNFDWLRRLGVAH